MAPPELPEPRVRLLTNSGQPLLERFTCSTGEWYENDVEHFLRGRLVSYIDERVAETDCRGLALLHPDGGELLAVGAHEEDLTRLDGQDLTSTLLVVGAVSLNCQGALLPEVEPLDPDSAVVTLGRYLMEMLLADALDRNRHQFVRAVVARENARSGRLCRRVGLTQERQDADDRFLQLTGVFDS